MAFLDENGLSHLWLKITNKITDMIPGVFKGATSSAAGEAGTVPAPSAGAATRFLCSNGTWAEPPGKEYEPFSGASASANGAAGLVPAPSSGENNMFLFGDGDWKSLQIGYEHDSSGKMILTLLKDTTEIYRVPFPDATQSAGGFFSRTDKAKLDGFSAASEYAKKSDISSVYKYKGSVANAAALPTSGQAVGDTYDIKAASSYGPAGTNVAWNGSAWDALGGALDLEAITNADIDEICV